MIVTKKDYIDNKTDDCNDVGVNIETENSKKVYIDVLNFQI